MSSTKLPADLALQLIGPVQSFHPGRRSVLIALGAAVALTGPSWAEPMSHLASRRFESRRHATHYLESGPADGPLLIFLHGWPELSLIWRAQMTAFAADGWRCIAPDMRGYGASSAPTATNAYANEQVVADMVELHDHLGGKPAVWVGHDWGSVIAGSMVAHHPERARAAVLVSVPYFPGANALPTLVPLVDRDIYPADRYPDGQWDYYRYYTEHLASAVADLDANKASSLASIFRRGDPAAMGKPTPNASVTRKGGRFGAAHRAPPTKPDPLLWPGTDFDTLVRSFKERGFRAPCAWYLNDEANIAYARRAPSGGRLTLPVLFVNGQLDAINTINGNRLGDPMRTACADLTVIDLPGAHWLPLECKAQLVTAMRDWMHTKRLGT